VTVPTLRGVLTALALLNACSVGTTGRNYAPAKGPEGVTVSLQLTGKRIMTGELLTVEQGSLLVLADRKLIRVALPAIQVGRASKVSFTGATLRDEGRERLRLISRFPAGVSPDLEGRLLEAYGQTLVQEVS
jgi:hypothetical protein